MGVAEALDQLPRPKTSPAERFRAALAMFDEGIALQRLTFQRKHPNHAEQELDQMLEAWLLREETS